MTGPNLFVDFFYSSTYSNDFLKEESNFLVGIKPVTLTWHFFYGNGSLFFVVRKKKNFYTVEFIALKLQNFLAATQTLENKAKFF